MGRSWSAKAGRTDGGPSGGLAFVRGWTLALALHLRRLMSRGPLQHLRRSLQLDTRTAEPNRSEPFVSATDVSVLDQGLFPRKKDRVQRLRKCSSVCCETF